MAAGLEESHLPPARAAGAGRGAGTGAAQSGAPGGPQGGPRGPQDDGGSVHGRFLWHYKSWRVDFDCHVLIHLDLFC